MDSGRDERYVRSSEVVDLSVPPDTSILKSMIECHAYYGFS